MFIVFPRFRLRVSVFALPIAFLMLWLEGTVPFLIITLSALLHETGHLSAMYLCGYSLRRLDILPMGALIVVPEGIQNRHEVIIALSGPFVSLLCASVASVLFAVNGSDYALFAAVINFSLGFFNLLPVKKLDGGKALYCFLADKKTEAEQICSLASVSAKIIFLSFALICIVLSNFNLGVIVLSATLIFQLFIK